MLKSQFLINWTLPSPFLGMFKSMKNFIFTLGKYTSAYTFQKLVCSLFVRKPRSSRCDVTKVYILPRKTRYIGVLFFRPFLKLHISTSIEDISAMSERD